MSTPIEANKKTVREWLSDAKNHLFVIPEHQRPYAWGEEEIQTLFDDLWEFASSEKGGSEHEGTYFLGAVVSYIEGNEQKIIAGQQLVTSLFLLLRAIYTVLSLPEVRTKEAQNFMRQIEPAIWYTDKLTGEANFSHTLLVSKVMNNEGNEILKSILETGVADEKASDNYSLNYIKFQNLLDEAASNKPLMFYDFIYAVLNQAILLPITADSQDTALTIFQP